MYENEWWIRISDKLELVIYKDKWWKRNKEREGLMSCIYMKITNELMWCLRDILGLKRISDVYRWVTNNDKVMS